MMNFLKSSLLINIIPLTGIAIACSELINAFMTRIYQSVSVLFSTNVYYFFEGYACPFPAHSLQIDNPHSAKPVYVYSVDSYTFFPYTCDFKNIKLSKLPMLSMEIVDSDGNVTYDLTNFIEKIRYISVMPTMLETLLCWTIHSGIVINTKEYSIRYINDDGDIIQDKIGRPHSE